MVVEITDLDSFGRGITRVNGKVYFVKNALPEEIVSIKVIEEKKNYGVAEVVCYNKKSPNRTQPLCPYDKECGGCHLSFLLYKDQLILKEARMKKELEKNHITNFFYRGLISGNPYHYRNKATFHACNQQLGFYQEGTHNLIPIDSCLLLDQRINNILKTLPKKEVSIRVSNVDDAMLIGNEQKSIRCRIGKYNFWVSPQSFFQVNNEITEKLYQEIYCIVKETKPEKVLDLYCGIGTIGIYIHELVKEVIGVEIVKEAIIDANRNKKENHIDNITFFCGDTSQFIKKFSQTCDLIIVDPPRSGLTPKVIENIIRISPTTIIYVSCNPSTLIRDIKRLENFYRLESIKLFDMFPNTYHIESCCVLKKLMKKTDTEKHDKTSQ